MATGNPRGRPPKTTAQKIAEGNRGKRKLPKRLLPEQAEDSDIPPAPDNLVADGREMWNRLWTAGKTWLHPEADYYLAKQACERYTAAEMYRRGLENGTYETFYLMTNGIIGVHPAVKQQKEATAEMNSALAQLAFTPTARARLEISLSENDDPILMMTEDSDRERAEAREKLLSKRQTQKSEGTA